MGNNTIEDLSLQILTIRERGVSTLLLSGTSVPEQVLARRLSRVSKGKDGGALRSALMEEMSRLPRLTSTALATADSIQRTANMVVWKEGTH